MNRLRLSPGGTRFRLFFVVGSCSFYFLITPLHYFVLYGKRRRAVQLLMNESHPLDVIKFFLCVEQVIDDYNSLMFGF